MILFDLLTSAAQFSVWLLESRVSRSPAFCRWPFLWPTVPDTVTDTVPCFFIRAIIRNDSIISDVVPGRSRDCCVLLALRVITGML